MTRSVIAVAFSILLAMTNAPACIVGGTGPKPICERFWEHDAVALADVVSIDESNFRRTVTLRVVEVFRGDPPSEITFADPRSDCGVNFDRKDRELVWLFKEGGKWKAFSDDARTQSADLAFARSVKNARNIARVYGDVGTAEPRHLVVGGPPAMGAPLTGSVVVASGEQGRFEAVVQKDGTFSLDDLPPGKYTINVETLPPNMEGDPFEVDLAAGACKQLYLRPDASGEISGRLVPGGKMPENAFVFLKRVPRDSTEEENHDVEFGVDVFADDVTGAFAFRHVRPGKYVLAFGSDLEDPTVRNPYEQNLYYRNSKDRNGAEVLELHEGQKIRDIEFKIGPEAQRRTIHVTATWQDGTPAHNFHVQLRNAENSYNLGDAQYTDETGNAKLTAFADIAYTLEAAGRCAQTSPQVINIVKNLAVRIDNNRTLPNQSIPASATDVSVTLIVPGSKCALDRPWWGSGEN